MRIKHLQAENLRCLESAQLTPGPGLNVLIGQNGAGKTSLLEAASLVLSARIPRGELRSALRAGSDSMTVFAEVEVNGTTHRVGSGLDTAGQRQRVDGEDARRSELARRFPVMMADPAVGSLVEEGPGQRRSYLDWGVFHVEHSFLECWRRYQRLLRQRNAALRQGSSADIWDAPLVEAADNVESCRRRYLARLQAPLESITAELFPDTQVSMDYRSGWAAGESLADALVRHAETDRAQGYTRVGPHRADIRLQVNDHAARQRLSRGELKLLGMSLLLAQLYLHLDNGLTPPILLLDDLAAELGGDRRQQLIEQVTALPIQILATFIEPAQVPRAGSGVQMFHVEHGVVTAAD